MPSATFLHLPQEKQDRLLEAATREFSRRPFSEASINQIIRDAGIPRGSFYMYFTDKEELFRYVMSGYVDQLLLVVRECLLRSGGDVFQAMVDLFDYVQQHRGGTHLGETGAMTAIIGCNSGMQKNVLLGMVDRQHILSVLTDAVSPDLLDLRRQRDLSDILAILLSLTAPLIYSGIQEEDSRESRERLVNLMELCKRGMAREKDPAPENLQTAKETV